MISIDWSTYDKTSKKLFMLQNWRGIFIKSQSNKGKASEYDLILKWITEFHSKITL